MEDRYEIRGKIGQGGMGSVYRAFDHKMNRQVAIKRMLSSGEDSSIEAEATKQMMVEVGALSSLQHPHIVTVFDVGEDEKGCYIVMELLDGKNLDEIVENAPLSWDDFRTVAMQSLEALLAAHHLDMIHSDLKPPNIMLTWMPSGAIQVKIVDFGLATLIHNQSQEEIEQMESTYGSVFFMPPEQFERKTLDTRSDIYSLGCCFYQALSGYYPFNGDTVMDVIEAHLAHKVRPIHEIRKDIPSWVCDWVMSMISRRAKARPASAREALAKFLKNDKISQKGVTKEVALSKNRPEQLVPIASRGNDSNKKNHGTFQKSGPPWKNKPLDELLVAACATKTGRRCLINEDRHLVDTTKGWFSIAGSVCGLPYGERASECTIRHLTREIARPESNRRELSDIVSSCHEAVRKLGEFLSPPTGIGSSLILLRFTTEIFPYSFSVAHVGDNAAYLHPARIHPLMRLSSDHTTEIQPASNTGETSGNIKAKPSLERYLGQSSNPDCEIRIAQVDPNDRIILCSDGVTRALDESEISDLSAGQPSATELARALVQITDIRGGRHNATAIVIDFLFDV